MGVLVHFRAALLLLCGTLGVLGATAQSISTTNPVPAAPQNVTPVEALKVNDFKKIDASTGWVNTGDMLLMTTDNGAHWKNISPSAPTSATPSDSRFSGVFFLNAQTGWVLYTTETDDADTAPSVVYNTYLESTADGGATWNTVSQLPPLNGLDTVGAGFVIFSDPLHGWVNLDAVHAGVLFATADAGHTWRRETGNPGTGSDLVAPDNQDLWMTGGIDYKLFASHDGGNSFQQVSIPLPANIDPDSYPTYSLTTFTDSKNGYETVDYAAGAATNSAIALFHTADGGQTWTLDREILNLPPSTSGEQTPSAIAGSTWILPLAPAGQQPKTIRLSPGAAPVDAAAANLQYNDCDLSFIAPDYGWMNCSGELFSTPDGGMTRVVITPRARDGVLTTDPVTPIAPAAARPALSTPSVAAPNLSSGPATGVSQRLGFDSTDVLSSDYGG
jgi:photosystem II stability/assembly factor-like uncharacterized protein